MKNRYLLPILFAAIAALLSTGCTDNERARNFGGTANVELPAGKKLVHITFKGDDLWMLTRQAKPGELPETLELIEESSFGLLSGKIVVHER